MTEETVGQVAGWLRDCDWRLVAEKSRNRHLLQLGPTVCGPSIMGELLPGYLPLVTSFCLATNVEQRVGGRQMTNCLGRFGGMAS